MCRHIGYLGPPVTLADLLLKPPRSLLRQSWAPVDMRGGGTINADGFGIGWYPDGDSSPVRYRRASPLWADGNLPRLAESVSSHAVLAAVRSGTIGMPIVETACAPFASGPWLFSHNGVVRGWPDSVAALAGELAIVDLLTMDAPTDAALLWLLVRRRLTLGQPPAEAVAGVVAEVAAAAPGSRLNLLLTDGTTLVGSTWTHALWVRRGDGAVVVTSEPHDDLPGWQEVPDGNVVVATPSTVDLIEIKTGET